MDRLEVHCAELEGWLGSCEPRSITGFNLSDIFEWMSDEHHERVYRAIVGAAAPGARARVLEQPRAAQRTRRRCSTRASSPPIAPSPSASTTPTAHSSTATSTSTPSSIRGPSDEHRAHVVHEALGL